MRLGLCSIFVDDQLAAADFYTRVLGFRERHRVAIGDAWWLTVVSPEDPDGTELLLEPAGHPAVGPYRDALKSDGIPLAQFQVDDLADEYARLQEAGVQFTMPPTDIGSGWVAVFDDTFGNLIQLLQPAPHLDDAAGGAA